MINLPLFEWMSMVLCEWHLHFGFQCGNEGSSMRQNVGSTKLVAHFILSPSCPKFHVQRFYVIDLFEEKLQCFTNKNIFTEIFVQRAVFEITVDHIMPTSCWNLGCPKQCVSKTTCNKNRSMLAIKYILYFFVQ